LHFEDFSLVRIDFSWNSEERSDKEKVKSGGDDKLGSFEDLDELVKILFPI
jgi:hypothetical protein